METHSITSKVKIIIYKSFDYSETYQHQDQQDDCTANIKGIVINNNDNNVYSLNYIT